MIDSCCLIVVSLDTLWGLPFCFPNSVHKVFCFLEMNEKLERCDKVEILNKEKNHMEIL